MLDWLAYTTVKALGALLCRLPPEVAIWLGRRMGDVAYGIQLKRRRIGVLNVRAAFNGGLSPRQAQRIVRESFCQIGAGVLELLRLPVMDAAYLNRYVTVENFGALEQAVASGRPVVLLTGHYGNWELSSIVSAVKGYPIAALARVQQKFPRLYRLLISYRESKGCEIVHKGGAMKRLLGALDRKRPIGIVGDQASRQGLATKFFGRPALFAKGPFDMAYSKQAIIVPAFIRRVRGPYHRVAILPPLELSRTLEKTQAIRQGIEQFAALLERQIRDDPGQWLWMHKRWKYTTARRVLVLSDGKVGHLKQSLAVVELLRERFPAASHEVAEVAYRSPLWRGACLCWSWWMPAGWGGTPCLRYALSPASFRAILTRHADLVVSCGASTVPVNALWARANRAKSVVIMNPSPLPLRHFDLVIAPRHDGLPRRRNVIQTVGALSLIHDGRLQEASGRLAAHPKFRGDVLRRSSERRAGETRHPVVAVFIGGETPQYTLGAGFVEGLTAQILSTCELVNGRCLVTTSRRTPAAVERVLTERLAKHARCQLLLLASRDALNGTMEGMLGAADVAVVTGESISMVSEACASGRRVVVVEPPLRRGNRMHLTKHQRFLRSLANDGHVRVTPIPEVGHAIRRALEDARSPKRLDNLTAVRDAVSRLF